MDKGSQRRPIAEGGGVIPRCCVQHRMATIEALSDLIAIDAYVAVADMVDKGWSAADAVASYREWLLELLAVGIDAGALLAESAA